MTDLIRALNELTWPAALVLSAAPLAFAWLAQAWLASRAFGKASRRFFR